MERLIHNSRVLRAEAMRGPKIGRVKLLKDGEAGGGPLSGWIEFPPEELVELGRHDEDESFRPIRRLANNDLLTARNVDIGVHSDFLILKTAAGGVLDRNP